MKQKKYAKTPTVYQMEATECGAASLTMILAYFGCFVPLEQMRIETGVSRDGCNARNIMKAGRKFGLEVHGYRKSLESLLELPGPCIIHWNFNHFVVWEGVKGRSCYINDPAMGRRRLTVDDIDSCFTGVVLTFEKTERLKVQKKKNTVLKFIVQQLKGQYSAVAALVILGIFLVAPGIMIPLFSQVFIDNIMLGGRDEWLPALLTVIAATAVIKSVLTYYRGYLLDRVQNKMMLISSYKFITHLLRLPISFFDQRSPGDLSQRVENNNKVSTFLISDLASTILNMLTAAAYLVLLFCYSPVLTFIGLGGVAVNIFIMNAGGRVISDLSLKYQQDRGKMIGTLFAGLTITNTLKATGTENDYVSRLHGYYAKSIVTKQKMGLQQELLNAVPEALGRIVSILILMTGGGLVINGSMTAGMLVAFISLLDSFSDPVNSMVSFIEQLHAARADIDRIDDIMRYKKDMKFDEYEKAAVHEKLSGDIELREISFGYNILEPPLVDKFSFSVKSGSSVALIGASGCGKSTVSKICSGLYMPWSGEFIVDGHNINSIPSAVVSASIATVSQEITIFSGTVKENITMWNRFIHDEDIVCAAKDACIHDVITSKPGAYDFMLAEGGTNFSGGQRQRLEIARALASNPSILIMDEATSALDPIVEKKIIDNIKRRGCTCIIVAHRLSAIRDCDEIIVMSKGQIVQRGTHDELAGQPGHYQRLIQNI